MNTHSFDSMLLMKIELSHIILISFMTWTYLWEVFPDLKKWGKKENHKNETYTVHCLWGKTITRENGFYFICVDHLMKNEMYSVPFIFN